MTRAPTKREELLYATGGLATILKGATITGVKMGTKKQMDEMAWYQPPLVMSLRFPKPVAFDCDGQRYEGIRTMDVLISQDPEGNGPGALIAETFAYEVPA